MPTFLSRFSKCWAALAVGASVVLAAGLITGSVAVWVSTGISAGTAALGVLLAPANSAPALEPASTGRHAAGAAPAEQVPVSDVAADVAAFRGAAAGEPPTTPPAASTPPAPVPSPRPAASPAPATPTPPPAS